MKLDYLNFDEDLIDEYFEKVVDHVFDLFQDTIIKDECNTDVQVSNEGVINVDVIDTAASDDYEINDQEMDLFSFVRQRIEIKNEESSNNHDNIEKKKKELRNKIKNSMDAYRDECFKMSMNKYLEENGNKLYKTMLERNKIDHVRIQKWDALYISKFFDAVQWWKDREHKYPELALAATIALGKPTHNAFQERVFSRGTYSDTKLRKRLKEEHFEMSVLNAVNGKEIDEVYELMKPAMITKEKERIQFMNDFLKKRNEEPDLTKAVEDDDKDEEKQNAKPEFESVCSENTRDMLSDDDDDDDDDALCTDRAIDNMENMSDDQNSKIKLV
jgi:hypothetical protein